jgi:uncharacterized protein involved in high-affinity Fe2+ transport
MADCSKLPAIKTFILLSYSASSGALTGHTPAQVPHPIQEFLSITYVVSPCDMHPTGHSAAQAPQLIHLSVILYAILVPSFFIYLSKVLLLLKSIL